MTELFPDIPEFIRKATDFWISRARVEDPMSAARMLHDFRKTLPTDEAKEYFDFAVQCQLLTIRE